MLYLLILIPVAVILYVIVTYNQLTKLKIKNQNQRSQIDVELKQRFDVIPNLVEVVKGYAAHELKTLNSIVEARVRYMGAKDTGNQLQANAQLGESLANLFVLAESYPDLKADENFIRLQKTLVEIENNIRFSRQFYNDSVYRLNTKIESFPSSFIAGMFGFKKEAFFTATEDEKKSIKVELTN